MNAFLTLVTRSYVTELVIDVVMMELRWLTEICSVQRSSNTTMGTGVRRPRSSKKPFSCHQDCQGLMHLGCCSQVRSRSRRRPSMACPRSFLQKWTGKIPRSSLKRPMLIPKGSLSQLLVMTLDSATTIWTSAAAKLNYKVSRLSRSRIPSIIKLVFNLVLLFAENQAHCFENYLDLVNVTYYGLM